jgi:hypothetical protein
MRALTLTPTAAADVPAHAGGGTREFIDSSDGRRKRKLPNGTVVDAAPEATADAAGAMSAADKAKLNGVAAGATATAFRTRSAAVTGSDLEVLGGHVSSVGGRARLDLSRIDVREFGAVGDGVTDDLAKLQDAVAAAIATNRQLYLPPAVYAVSGDLVVAGGIEIRGGEAHGMVSTLKAIGTSVRESVLTVRGIRRVSQLHLDANSKAKVGLAVRSCGMALFDRVTVTSPLLDGVHLYYWTELGARAVNNNNCVTGITATACGRVYCAAAIAGDFAGYGVTVRSPAGSSVAVSAAVDGYKTLTFAGVNLQPTDGQLNDADAIPLRRGDPVRYGSGETWAYRTVYEVLSATQCTVYDPGAITGSGLSYAIGVGDGWHEERSGDNNITTIRHGLFRSCAGFGMAHDGLYGPSVDNVQIDVCPFWAVRVGSNGPDAVLSSKFSHLYFEGIGRAVGFLFHSAQGVTVDQCMDAAMTTARFEYGGAAAANFGLYISPQLMEPIGTMAMQGIPVDQVRNGTHSGRVYVGLANVSVGGVGDAALTLTGTNTFRSPIVRLSGIESPVTLSGSPVIEADPYRELRVQNMSPVAVTLESYGARAASGLHLRTPTVVLNQYDSILLWHDGSRWQEIGRSIAAT